MTAEPSLKALDVSTLEQTVAVNDDSAFVLVSAFAPEGVSMTVTMDGKTIPVHQSVDDPKKWYCDSDYIRTGGSTYEVTFSKEGAQSTTYTVHVTGGTPPSMTDASCT